MEQPRKDPYVGIITLFDVNDVIRGWGGEKEGLHYTQISRHTVEQVIPPGHVMLIPRSSRTLSRTNVENVTPMADDVQLRLQGCTVFSSAVKLALVFSPTIPFLLEQNALVCNLSIVVHAILVQITLPFACIHATASPRLVTGSKYTMQELTSTAASHSENTFEFKFDGTIFKRTQASAVLISEMKAPVNKSDIAEKINRIQSQVVIASAWVQCSSLTVIFPTSKVKTSVDHKLAITSDGIRMQTMINGKEAVLNLRCEDAAKTCTEYGFSHIPTCSLYGTLLTSSAPKLGKCFAPGYSNNVSITFYGKVDEYYYLKIGVSFDPMASGAVYIPIVESKERINVSLPPSQERGDEAFATWKPPQGEDSLIITAGVTNSRPEVPQPLPIREVPTHSQAYGTRVFEPLALPGPQSQARHAFEPPALPGPQPTMGLEDQEDDEESEEEDAPQWVTGIDFGDGERVSHADFDASDMA